MSNNNCLSHWEPAMEPLDQFNSQNYPLDSPIHSSFKDSDLFIKSQVSMVDTTCDEHSPISHKF